MAVAAALLVSLLTRSDSPQGQGLGSSPKNSTAAPADPGAVRAALARAALQRQQDAVHTDSRRAFQATWDAASEPAKRRATSVFANLRALDVTFSDTRYVAADVGSLSAAAQRRLGGRAWTAEVELSWRLRHYDERSARALLTYTFVRRGSTAYVADIAPSRGGRQPIWLLDSLVVRRGGRTLVAASSSRSAARLDRLLHLAVADVRRVLPTWHGDLVSYEPQTRGQFQALLGATPGTYDHIAAVTSTVDGSTSEAPVAIVVNADVFDRLGPVAARVVISHEATHVATGAASKSLPLWVAEGFADYVGVGSVDVPLSVSAGAVRRDIRRHGLPRALPSNAQFSASGSRLEVSYEQAWLAARLIAKRYGEARLLAFYQRVVQAPDAVNAALRTELGTSRAALTRQWRAYLRTVAGAA